MNRQILQEALNKQLMKVQPIKKPFVFIILPFIAYMNKNGEKEITLG